jgi:flagellar capping protein FliD
MTDEIWHIACGDHEGKQLCEGQAYQIEIRRLKAELEQSSNSFESLFSTNKIQIGIINRLEEKIERLSKRGIETMQNTIKYQDVLINSLYTVLTDVKNTSSDLEDNCVDKLNEISQYNRKKAYQNDTR